MEDSATCIFCGEERPTDEELCPSCGKPWIDQWIEEAGVGSTAAPAFDPAAPPPPSGLQRARPWIIAAVVAVIVMALYGVVFGFALRDTGTSATPPASTGSTIGLASTTTEAVVTTTTTRAPIPTTTTPGIVLVEPVDPPIPVRDLDLGAFSLGPLEFGDEDAEAMGRLAASLGQPDALLPIGEAQGLCPAETGVEATWGWLTALFRTEGEVDVLVGYRFATDLEEPDHETRELTTISGATIGDTVGEFTAIYAPSPVSTTVFDGIPGYILTRQSDGRTLLWGESTGDQDTDLITAIFAPRPCDGGPFADN